MKIHIKIILPIIVILFLLILLAGCLPGLLTPPPPKGVISGRIMVPSSETAKDITGWIPVANATVTLTDSEGVSHTVTTDEDGYYTFTNIAVNANTIITATATVDGDTVIIKDVIPQAVAATEDYEAGTADAESTALGLIVEELLEQELDPEDINLEEIQDSDNFTEVVEQVSSILEENGNVTTDPDVTETVSNATEEIINPPVYTPPEEPPEEEYTPPVTPKELTEIMVLPETMVLFVGEDDSITSIIASYSYGSDTSRALNVCSYSSDDVSVATVATGVVTGVGAGSATIKVSYTEGGITKEDTVAVTVNPVLLDYIIVLPETMTLFEGGKTDNITSINAHYNNGAVAPINPGNCTITSDNPAVAIVDASGIVTSVDPDTATITVSYAGKTDTVEVTVINELVIADIDAMGRPQLLGTIKTDGSSVIFDIRAIGQVDDGDDINTSRWYTQTYFDNEYFTISAAGKFLKYNMFMGNTTPYWGTSWSASDPLPAGVTFSQTEDGDDFVYAVSMSYAILGISVGDTFSVQIKARDFNDDFVQSYSGYDGFDGEYSHYNGLWITDTGTFDVTLP